MKKTSFLIILSSLFLLNACSSGDGIDHLSMGDKNAPVLIEEFSDIECPACGIISPMVEQLAKENSDIVRLDYYHFPLSYHEYAFKGAEAVECAEDQDKGWEYLSSLFTNQAKLSDDFFETLAEAHDLNITAFRNCLENGYKRELIRSHQAEGKSRSLPGTPSIFINGSMVQWSGYDQLNTYIKSLAASS